MSWNLDDLGAAFNSSDDEDLAEGACAVINLTTDGPAAHRHAAAASGARSLQLGQQLPMGQKQQSNQAHRASAAAATAQPVSRLERKLQFYVQNAGGWATGDKLKALRDQNAQEGVRESYAQEHLRRLLKFEAVAEFEDKGSKVYCNRVHGPGCRECNTCHFCRQKTVDVKTYCACASQRGLPGGPGRGIWCGNCLWMRMGENINEVLQRSDWSCPACRDICNCSNTSCLRKIKGHCDTKQLYHEAHKLGYKSVAHYLIVTHLDDSKVFAGAMPKLDAAAARRQQQRQQQASAALQHQRSQLADIPGAGASVNALHEQTRRQRKLVEQQTQAMLEACEAAFAGPLEDGLADLLADQGTGSGILDATELAADDDLKGGLLSLSRGATDLSPDQPSPTLQLPMLDAHNTSNRPSGAVGQQRRTSFAGMRNSSPSPAATGNSAGATVGASAAGAGGRPRTIRVPEQITRSTPSPHGVLSPNGLFSPSAATPGTDFPMFGRLNLQQGSTLHMGLLGIQCFDDDVLPEERPSLFEQQQISTAAGGAAGSARGHEASHGGPNSSGGNGTAPQRRQQQQQQHNNQQAGQQHRPPLHPLPQQQNNQQQVGQEQLDQEQKQKEQRQQQQRLQHLQVDESYAPGDLPGSDAPGYGERAGQGDSARRKPSRPQQHAWLCQPVGLSAAGTGAQLRKRSTWFSRTADTYSRGVSAGGGGGSSRTVVQAIGRAPAGAGGIVRGSSPAMLVSAEVATAGYDMEGAPAFKRARVDAQQVAAGAAAINPPPLAAVAVEGTSAGGATAIAGAYQRDMPVVQQQQQQFSGQPQQQPSREQQRSLQHQRPVVGGSAPAAPCGAAAAAVQPVSAASRGSAELLSSRLLQHLKMVRVAKQALRLQQSSAVRFGCNSKYGCERLNKQLFDIWTAEFGTDNSKWQSAMVVNDAFGASVGSIEELKAATTLMLELSTVLRLGDVCEDLRWRLTGVLPFLDFKLSYPPARIVLLSAYCSLMTTLAQRGSAYESMATAEAAVYAHAAALTSTDAAACSAAAHQVQQAAASALDDMQQAESALLELVESLLDAVKSLDEEFRCIGSWLNGPKDLLEAIAIGPVNWPAFRSSTTGLPLETAAAANMAAMRNIRLLQEEQQQLERDQRRVQLQGLADADQLTVQKLMLHLSVLAKSPLMTRKVAAAFLARPELGALLDIQVTWSAATRRHVLQTVTALIQHAAPDLVDDEKWYVQDSGQLKQMLVQQQQQQAGWEQLTPDSVAQEQVLLLEQVLSSKVPQADRLAEVRQLHAVVQQQYVALHVEQLVAAEYISRQNLVKDALAPGQQPTLPGEQSPELTAQQEKWRLTHSQTLKHCKLDALAAVYTLQLQAGAKSWAEMEKQLIAPASSLTGLSELQTPELRLMVLALTGTMIKQVPSLVQQQGTVAAVPAQAAKQGYLQQQQQQQQVSPVPGYQHTSIPAMWLLQLWLRSVFDSPAPLQRAHMLDFSAVLASHPVTAGLFPSCEDLLQWKQLFLEDKTGIVRGQLVWRVAGSFAGTGRFRDLRDLLSGLHQALCARQTELETQSNPALVLLWQRSCMPGLLILVDAAAEVLGSCSNGDGTSAAAWAGARQQSSCARGLGAAGAAGLSGTARDLKDSIRQMMALASNWLRAGVEAVCGRDSGRASRGSGSHAHSGSTNADEARCKLQMSALAELRRYLATLVSLAGRGCLLDGVRAEKWPIDSTGSGRKLMHHYAVAPPQQQPLNLPCLSELVSSLLAALSADDQPQPAEQLLLNYVAKVLVDVSGLSDAAVANRQATPEAAATQPQGAAATVPLGYKSPGLLHLLLSTHIRLALEASAGKCPTPQAHERAVNAMHLVKAVFDRPEQQQLQHQQLLLPCLARPLVEQLAANGNGVPLQQQFAAQQQQPVAKLQAAVQLQVHKLLEQLLTRSCGQLLAQEMAATAGGSSISFDSGPIRTISPVSVAQLQQLLLILLRLGLQACPTLAAAAAGVNAAAVAAAVQQQAPQGDASTAVAPGAAGLSSAHPLLPLQRTDGTSAVSSLLVLTGPPAVVPSELMTWSGTVGGSKAAAARAGASLAYAADRPVAALGTAAFKGAGGAAVPENRLFTRPDDYEWTVAKNALHFCANVARCAGVLQQHVLLVLPSLYQLMVQAGVRGKPLLPAYNQIIAELPQPIQQRWRLPDQVEMPPPLQVPRPLQQQHQQHPPADNAPAPRQARLPQQQHQQHQQCRPAASSADCGSQAWSAAAPGPGPGNHHHQQQQQQQDNELAEGLESQQHKRMRIAAPTTTLEYSQGGGRAASCTIVQTQQARSHLQQQQHLAGRAAGGAASIPAAAVGAPSAVAGGPDDDEASSRCTASTQPQVQLQQSKRADPVRQQPVQTRLPAVRRQQQQSHQQQQQQQQEKGLKQQKQKQLPQLVQITGEVVHCNIVPRNVLAYDLALVVYERGYLQAGSQTPNINRALKRVLLKGDVAERARQLCAAGQLNKGTMASVSEVQHVNAEGIKDTYISTASSKLHLQHISSSSLPGSAQETSDSSGVTSNSSGRAGAGVSTGSGFGRTAVAAAITPTSTTPGTAGAAAPAACTGGLPAAALGAEAATTATHEGPSSDWWNEQQSRHMRLRKVYLQQQKLQAQKCSQLCSPQQEASQDSLARMRCPGSHSGPQPRPDTAGASGAAAPSAAAATAAAGGVAPDAGQRATSAVEDSQATVKYMTLPSQSCS